VILLPCPHCGPRNASEFRHFGEERERPDPNGATPDEWRAYLYLKGNPAGWTTETWCHTSGCGAFFIAERHTVTNRVRSVRLPGRSAT
jgi:sarcosine oxidase subunit delta